MDNVDKVFFVQFRYLWILFGHLNTYLVVFSRNLAIIKKEKKTKKKNIYIYIYILIWIKVDKGRKCGYLPVFFTLP